MTRVVRALSHTSSTASKLSTVELHDWSAHLRASLKFNVVVTLGFSGLPKDAAFHRPGSDYVSGTGASPGWPGPAPPGGTPRAASRPGSLRRAVAAGGSESA